jgi:hypothetical protein
VRWQQGFHANAGFDGLVWDHELGGERRTRDSYMSGFPVLIMYATASAASTSLILDETNVEIRAYRYLPPARLSEAHAMQDGPGKPKKQSRASPTSRGPGTRSCTRLLVIDLSCNGAFVPPGVQAPGCSSRVPRPSPRHLRPDFEVRRDRSQLQSGRVRLQPANGVPPGELVCLPLAQLAQSAACHSQVWICRRLKEDMQAISESLSTITSCTRDWAGSTTPPPSAKVCAVCWRRILRWQ